MIRQNGLFLFILLWIFTGCATTRSPSSMDNMQIKVAQLENSIKQQGQEMEALKYEVQDISSQIEQLDVNAMGGPIEEPLINEQRTKSSPAKTFKESDIIKVEAEPIDVQRALKKAGYYDGVVDGKIGPKTKDAIKQFQNDHDLKADGIIGSKTWSELKSYLK